MLEAQDELGFTHGEKGGSRRRFNQERDKVRVSFWGDGARPQGKLGDQRGPGEGGEEAALLTRGLSTLRCGAALRPVGCRMSHGKPGFHPSRAWAILPVLGQPKSSPVFAGVLRGPEHTLSGNHGLGVTVEDKETRVGVDTGNRAGEPKPAGGLGVWRGREERTPNAPPEQH